MEIGTLEFTLMTGFGSFLFGIMVGWWMGRMTNP